MKLFVVEKPKLSTDPKILTDLGDVLEFDEVVFSSVQAESADLNKISIIDSRLDKGNLSAAKLTESLLQRVQISDSRMSGADVYDAIIKDVEFVNCKLDLVNFRSSKFKNVRFVDCVLTEADFQGSTITNVEFVRCNINKANFNNCVFSNCDFRSSTFTDIIGAKSLKGATMSREQLIMLAPIFANEVGIAVEED